MTLRDSQDYEKLQKSQQAVAGQRSKLQEGLSPKAETTVPQSGYDAYEQHLLAKLVKELHNI